MFLIIFLFNLSLQKLLPKNVHWAVSSGSEQKFTSKDNILYERDQNYSDSIISDYNLHPDLNEKPIRFTQERELYMIERTSQNDQFHYDIPLNIQADFVLIIKLCEMWFLEPNKRVFDIYIGDYPLFLDIDIVKQVGPHSAFNLYKEFQVKKDGVYLDNKKIQSDIQNLRLILKKGKLDNPIINAILVYKGKLQGFMKINIDTEYMQYQITVKRQMEYDLKNLEKNNHIEKIQKQFEVNKLKFQYETYFQAIQRIMTQNEGLIIIALILSYIILLLIFQNGNQSKKKVE